MLAALTRRSPKELKAILGSLKQIRKSKEAKAE